MAEFTAGRPFFLNNNAKGFFLGDEKKYAPVIEEYYEGIRNSVDESDINLTRLLTYRNLVNVTRELNLELQMNSVMQKLIFEMDEMEVNDVYLLDKKIPHWETTVQVAGLSFENIDDNNFEPDEYTNLINSETFSDAKQLAYQVFTKAIKVSEVQL